MSMMNEIDSNLIEIKRTEGLIDANLNNEGRSKDQQKTRYCCQYQCFE
jgi:hypothetical protein